MSSELAPDPRRWKALALLCTAFFMAMLDSSIVLVALPSIDADLSFSAHSLQWVMSAYLLSFGGLLLLGGRAADLLGRRRTFMAGAGLFALASLTAGLSPSGAVLIAARAIQGAAAAVMTPTALSIVMTTFPEGAERNKALGIWTSTGGIGGTVGWLIGGPITDGLGWEWIFLLNVPVAVAVAALSPALLRESLGKVGARRFDIAGAVTITSSLVALVYAVVEAPDVGWTSGRTLGLLALSALLAASFVATESRSAAPLVPLRVFRSRTLVGSNLLLMALGTAAFGVPFVLTQYAQQVLGWSPVEFGVAFVISPLMVAITSTVAQKVATRCGLRPVAIGAMCVTVLSSLLFTRLPTDAGYLGDIFAPVVLLGVGIGGAYLVGSIGSLSGVDESEAGLASGLSNASFQIGAAIGVAILSTVLASGAHGSTSPAALTHGFQQASVVSIAFAGLGILVSGLLPGREAGAGALADAEPSAA